MPMNSVKPDLETLVRLFYKSSADLGKFDPASGPEIPAVYAGLLAHEHHMTVTVEKFHRTPVDVQVLETRIEGDLYARKILLSRQNDGGIVQFGIMRVNFAFLAPEVRAEIERQRTPLGRILIQHNVLRDIRLDQVWRVAPGPDLLHMFGLQAPQTTYGRTAMIDCNDEPAIELLEIVTPVDEAAG
jgi:chorismate-pyruvate lyase